MKICNKCEINKPLTSFHKSRGTCKVCRKELAKIYYSKSEVKKHRNERQKKWYSKVENKEKSIIYQKQYNAKSENKIAHSYTMEIYHSRPDIKVKRKKYEKEYYRVNKAFIKAKTAKRRASKLNATPKWLTNEHLQEIREIYKTCPEGYHVDHIVPLQGKNVSGLHVPWNLRHLDATLNLKKGNKLVKLHIEI